MDEEERKKIQGEIAERKKELDSIKSQLSLLNTEKESWFDKKRKATKDISDVLQTLRDAKGKRNTFTKQVKDSKQRREELNTLLRQKIDEMRKLQKEKQDITDKFGMHIDPSRIQEEIEKLDFKVETEALPFHIEQKIMKMIGEKKKILAQSREVSDVFERLHALGKEVDRIRQKADETHKKIQVKAESSQQFHEELIESSKEMKEMRAKEEEALKKFVELKTKYNELNEVARAKFAEMNTLRAKIDDSEYDEKRNIKKVEGRKLQDQKRTVEEKIKKGMKLTTEDLLAFQAEDHETERHRDRQQMPRREEPKKRRDESPKQKSPKTEAKKEQPPAEGKPEQQGQSN